MSPRNPDKPFPSTIDREWSHQVALADDLCTDHNFTLIGGFCDVHGLKFPKRDREGGKVGGVWRREGVWTRLLESGPLKVPPILRD